MAKCDYCGTMILFGGVTDGDLRFCNQRCHEAGGVLNIVDQLPQDVVAEHIDEIHEGDCPKCGGPGPVDVHTSHTVYSLLVLTTWNSHPQVCCRGCGTKSKLISIITSGLFGWWGFPWGFIVTPIQIGQNAVGLFTAPGSSGPSPELRKLVRLDLARRLKDHVEIQPTRAKRGAKDEDVIEDFDEA